MQTAVYHVDLAHRVPAFPLPLNLTLAIFLTKRSHTRKIFSPSALANNKNILSLHSVTSQGECEHMYTGTSTTNTNAECISRLSTSPINLAPTNSSSSIFEHSTQHTIHIISSHLRYAFRNPRVDYQDRVCPHCLATGKSVLGDELHIICHCPATKKFTTKFQRLTQLLNLSPFASFFEHIELQAKLLDYFLRSNKSNINQTRRDDTNGA